MEVDKVGKLIADTLEFAEERAEAREEQAEKNSLLDKLVAAWRGERQSEKELSSAQLGAEDKREVPKTPRPKTRIEWDAYRGATLKKFKPLRPRMMVAMMDPLEFVHIPEMRVRIQGLLAEAKSESAKAEEYNPKLSELRAKRAMQKNPQDPSVGVEDSLKALGQITQLEESIKLLEEKRRRHSKLARHMHKQAGAGVAAIRQTGAIEYAVTALRQCDYEMEYLAERRKEAELMLSFASFCESNASDEAVALNVWGKIAKRFGLKTLEQSASRDFKTPGMLNEEWQEQKERRTLIEFDMGDVQGTADDSNLEALLATAEAVELPDISDLVDGGAASFVTEEDKRAFENAWDKTLAAQGMVEDKTTRDVRMNNRELLPWHVRYG